LYKSTANDTNSAISISGEITTNFFEDFDVTADIPYYYFVKAGNSNGWSDFSLFNVGYSKGTLISYEGFEYSDNTILKDKTGGQGWLDSWTGNVGSNCAPGLTYSDSRELFTTGIAGKNYGDNCSRLIGTNGLSHLLENVSGTNKFGKDDTELWFSFIGFDDEGPGAISFSFHDGGEWSAKNKLEIGSYAILE